MLLLNGLQKRPYWIAVETDDDWIDLYHFEKPFVDTEAGKDLFLEALAQEWISNPLRPALKEIHCFPLAWGELLS